MNAITVTPGNSSLADYVQCVWAKNNFVNYFLVRKQQSLAFEAVGIKNKKKLASCHRQHKWADLRQAAMSNETITTNQCL